MIIEIAAAVAILVFATSFVDINPYLKPGEEELPEGWVMSTPYYKYVSEELTLERGENVSDTFEYPTYEPMVILINIIYHSAETEGNYTIYYNDLFVANITASKDMIDAGAVAASCCGVEWVRPGAINTVTFTSSPEAGYEGKFHYTLQLRKA